jgi:hypothetical protein
LVIPRNIEESACVKVKDLVIGELYHIDPNPHIYARLGEIGWLQLHKHTRGEWGVDLRLSICSKDIMVYLGRITSRVVSVSGHPVRETAHSFAIGERIVYIYGEHIRHVLPFTAID